MNVKEAFDRSAGIYDRARRQLVPCFDDFYATALDRIPYAPEQAFEVLDLGAGTGLFAYFVAAAFPRARFTLLDVSAEMLERARERFAGAERFAFVQRDFAEPLPGVYDLVISGLAIHHLSDEAKRSLFARILEALRPGGIFINADQVMGPTPDLERAYDDAWLRQVRARGVSDADLLPAIERMKEDCMAPLEDQLRWLREAGFADVDCWYKHYRFAVFSGSRRAA